MLRYHELEQDYAAAWEEWEASSEEAAWELTAADGLADAPRCGDGRPDHQEIRA